MKKLSIYALLLAVFLTCSVRTQAAIPIANETVAPAKEKITTPKATTAKKVDNLTKQEKRLDKKIKRKKTWLKRLLKKGGDSQIVGALLAFFLGNFGAHRFYYGDTGKGFLMLGITLAGIALIIIGIATLAASATISVPVLALIGYAMIFATSIWAFVDFIRILIGSYPS